MLAKCFYSSVSKSRSLDSKQATQYQNYLLHSTLEMVMVHEHNLQKTKLASQ